MQPKVLLEFNYPDDEDRLLFAIKGPEMYKALTNIKMAVTGEFPHKADLNAAGFWIASKMPDHLKNRTQDVDN